MDLPLCPLSDTTYRSTVLNGPRHTAKAVIRIFKAVGPGTLLAARVGAFMQIKFYMLCHTSPRWANVAEPWRLCERVRDRVHAAQGNVLGCYRQFEKKPVTRGQSLYSNGWPVPASTYTSSWAARCLCETLWPFPARLLSCARSVTEGCSQTMPHAKRQRTALGVAAGAPERTLG